MATIKSTKIRKLTDWLELPLAAQSIIEDMNLDDLVKSIRVVQGHYTTLLL